MSDFHPESWNPLWSVGTILSVNCCAAAHRPCAGRPHSCPRRDTGAQGLQSFMTEDSDAVGSMRSSVAQRSAFALDSLNFNMRDKSVPIFRSQRCSPLMQLRMFSSLFADQIPQWRQQLEERAKSSGDARFALRLLPLRCFGLSNRQRAAVACLRPLRLTLLLQAYRSCPTLRPLPQHPAILPFFSRSPWRLLFCT